MGQVRIDWIEPGILAGGGIPLGRKDLDALREQGIRAIVTLTEHPLTVQTEITPLVLKEMGFLCLHAPVRDQYPPDRATVDTVTQFLRQMRLLGRPALLHCHAGVGRTGTLLHAYYLMEGLSLEEAQSKVRAGRCSSQFLLLSDAQKVFLEELARERDGGA